MTDREDMDMLAAEYVLGTLNESERAGVAARRPQEPELDAAISDWEVRLSPMLADVADATPRADLLKDIQAQIARKHRPEAARTAAGGEVIRLKQRLSRWRFGAIGAGALAAALAAFIIYSDVLRPPADQNFVAVFQEGDKPPQFILSINLASRELTIRPVAAPSHPGKTYQLWIASDELGNSPQSLGLLDAPEKPTRKHLQRFDPKLLQEATFGISVEPEGGSPTGKPTGPALHGKLIPNVS